MSPEAFRTLGGVAEAELRLRGSAFVSLAAPVRDEAEARRVLEERRRARWDATHHCSAWRLRSGLWRTGDDGGPSGSAGVPILAAVDCAEVLDCIVVVTRYFGGTKLGVGGLAQAEGAEMEHGYVTNGAAARMEATVPTERVDALRERLRDETAGEVTVEGVGERVLYRNAHPTVAVQDEGTG